MNLTVANPTPTPWVLSPPPALPSAATQYNSAACMGLDPTSAAVVRYLTTDRQDLNGHYKAFGEVVAILYASTLGTDNSRWQTQRLFLTGEPFLETTRTGEPIRSEGSVGQTTWAWIELWLLEKLKPYHGLSADEILAKAEAGEFKKFALTCRNDLRREVQKQKGKPKLNKISIDKEVGEGEQTPLLTFMPANLNDVPSSLATHLPLEDRMRAVEALLRKAVNDHAAELDELDLLDGFKAFSNCIELLEPTYKTRGEKVFYDRVHDESVFRRGFIDEICRVRSVSKAGARAYSRRFVESALSELDRGNPIVCEIFDELTGHGANRHAPLPFFALHLSRGPACADGEEESRERDEEIEADEEVEELAVAA
jgi:hypothetical protein